MRLFSFPVKGMLFSFPVQWNFLWESQLTTFAESYMKGISICHLMKLFTECHHILHLRHCHSLLSIVPRLSVMTQHDVMTQHNVLRYICPKMSAYSYSITKLSMYLPSHEAVYRMSLPFNENTLTPLLQRAISVGKFLPKDLLTLITHIHLMYYNWHRMWHCDIIMWSCDVML